MAEDVKSVSEGWPKWQIALAIGAPTVLGLAGIWYWRRSNNVAPPEKTVVPDKPVPEDVKEEDTKPLVRMRCYYFMSFRMYVTSIYT